MSVPCCGSSESEVSERCCPSCRKERAGGRQGMWWVQGGVLLFRKPHPVRLNLPDHPKAFCRVSLAGRCPNAEEQQWRKAKAK